MAGGVALNCVANGKLLRSRIFDELWVQPAAGDAGGALGAACVATHHHRRRPVPEKGGRDLMRGALLGPEHGDAEIAAFLEERGLPHRRLDAEALREAVSGLLAEGKVVGWYQGRMEFGPRALGSRSILGDARDPGMQRRMNLKVKYRESFRPFAPAVLAEEAARWFDLDVESPYMLLTAEVHRDRRRPAEASGATPTGLDLLQVVRSEIPAVTHVDHSARVQTVRREDNPAFHALLAAFFRRTGCPLLVNTSFNVRGEPMVESPEDAWRCFMRTEIDALAMGSFLLHKAGQPPYREAGDWRARHELD
jgi:carbamoyltransferase